MCGQGSPKCQHRALRTSRDSLGRDPKHEGVWSYGVNEALPEKSYRKDNYSPLTY